MKSTIERLAEMAKAVHAKAKHVDRLNPAFAYEFVKSGWVVREDDYTQALDACTPAAIAQAHAEYAELERRNAELVNALELADCALSGANMDMTVVERAVKAALAHSAQEQGHDVQ